MSPRNPAREEPFYDRAVTNVERAIDETGVSQKELCVAIGIQESPFSQKLRGVRSHFSEDEFEAVAAFFRRHTGRPLTGFPHLDWALMEGIDRKMFGWKP